VSESGRSLSRPVIERKINPPPGYNEKRVTIL